MLALTLDIMIVILLLISLGAGLRLHGALKIFRVDSSEFQPMIQSLDKATTRAEAALRSLKIIAGDVGSKLNDEAKTTQRLLDELDFMTKRADQMAEQLNNSIGAARSVNPKAAPASRSIERETSGDVGFSPKQPRRRAPDLEQRLKSLR